MLAPWKKSYDQPRQHIKKQRHYFANKGPSTQAMVFPVVMYGCESWTIKKLSAEELMLLTVVLEMTLESPLAQELQLLNPHTLEPTSHNERSCMMQPNK